MKRFLMHFYRELKTIRDRFRPRVVSFAGNLSGNAKWALVSYLPGAINLKDGDKRLSVHSNWWECREIARILSSFGYNVESISYNDMETIPPRQYDLVFDIERNLARLAPFQKRDTTFLMMLTGSYLHSAVSSERKRVNDFNNRHQAAYLPKYAHLDSRNMDSSLQVAHTILLIGNETTKNTYPDWSRVKMRHCPVTIVPPFSHKSAIDNSPSFLYFFSGRNVAKGLDLVLDAVARHRDWSLHVAGTIDEDFPIASMASANVHFEGFVKPDSKRFHHLIQQVSAFVAPTCSEGTSPAVLTCMCAGLYPIVSRNTGVDLPNGCGIVLDELTPESVERGMLAFLTRSPEEIARQTDVCRSYVLSTHSRAAFSRAVESAFAEMVRT